MSDPERLSHERVYHGTVFDIDRDRVRMPNGREVTVDVVRHPKSVVLLPVPQPGHVILIKQYRYAADDFIYEIPAGKLDGGEKPEVCAERELCEETGCTAEKIEHLYTFYTTPGFTDERIHTFMATGLTRGSVSHEKDEFMSLETVTLSQALELIRTGVLKDAKSALAILYVAGFRLGQ